MANGDGESYQFPVTITISDLRTDTHYAENGVSSIQIIKNKSYYDYKISKSALVLSTVVSSDGRELRKYTGALASTDKLCFGTIGDYDIWENRRKEYRFPLGQFLILRNGVDVTTSCYSVTVNYY